MTNPTKPSLFNTNQKNKNKKTITIIRKKMQNNTITCKMKKKKNLFGYIFGLSPYIIRLSTANPQHLMLSIHFPLNHSTLELLCFPLFNLFMSDTCACQHCVNKGQDRLSVQLTVCFCLSFLFLVSYPFTFILQHNPQITFIHLIFPHKNNSYIVMCS